MVGSAPDPHGILDALRSAGVMAPGAAARLSPLTGGVSSDVFRMDLADGRAFAVKRAIPRMRVAEEWIGPVARAETEVAWLRFARSVDARLAPQVTAEVPETRIFVMAFLDPATHPVWKSELAEGRVDPDFAAAVGADLARIHAASAGRPEIAARFADQDAFFAMRISPFLLRAAERNPDVAAHVESLAEDLGTRRIALVHGDVSPKNILMGPAGPVFLDAETAVYGDPAFDFAFCFSHLLLKAVWVTSRRAILAEALAHYRRAYLAGVTWEAPDALAARAVPLIGALLLARVDGKSPAPYLTDPADQAFVRARARAILADGRVTLEDLERGWAAELNRE
jgi:aminoglycoside phosphotransferase (APT) family kinase protein